MNAIGSVVYLINYKKNNFDCLKTSYLKVSNEYKLVVILQTGNQYGPDKFCSNISQRLFNYLIYEKITFSMKKSYQVFGVVIFIIFDYKIVNLVKLKKLV